MSIINTILVGYGLSGRAFHAPFLLHNPAYKVVAVVQPKGNSAREALPGLEHYRSLEAALQQVAADLVVLTAPNEQHAPLCEQALMAGKHVVVEKPFALNVAEATALLQLAEKQQRVLSIFHNRRWDGDFLTVKKLLQEQRVGVPIMLVSRFDRFRPQIKKGWREETGPGTGILHDLGSHLIDQALVLFGWPLEVYAHLRQERAAAQTTDAFDLYLYYQQLTVHLAAGSLVSAPWPRFSLLGTEGSYTKWGMDPQEAVLRAGGLPSSVTFGKEEKEARGVLNLQQEGALVQQSMATEVGNYGTYYQQLAACIQGQGQNPVPPKEALQVMQLLALAEESYRQSRRIAATKYM